jgi:23S rRNA (cytosine1962-C5)-methyltransferase
MNSLTLKKGKEIPILNRHHWIFSGAIDFFPREFKNGEIMKVYSFDNNLLGHAYINSKTDIVARMINFDDSDPLNSIRENIQNAINLRTTLFENTQTNSFRLINSEGDGIPGLTVDKYNDVLVMQVSTLGIELMKDFIVKTLVELINPKTIFEKSSMPSRRREGLENSTGFLYGKEEVNVTMTENGVKFLINLENSHKTGFYLDQREMRKLIGEMATGKRLLNCFSYTGGFSLYAALNGATTVDSVDISEEVIEQAKKNFEINGLDPNAYGFYAKDVFKFLRENELNYDIVILDPPAFAKKRADVSNAVRGYRDINFQAISRMPKNSFLLTCSCSHHVDEELFKKTVTQAASASGREVKIIQSHRLAMDHAINIYHPEVSYLKSLLLYIY